MSLVKDSYKAQWPYQRFIQSNLRTFIEKLLLKINLGTLTKKDLYFRKRKFKPKISILSYSSIEKSRF